MKSKTILYFLFNIILAINASAQEAPIVSKENIKSQISEYKQEVLNETSKSLQKLKSLKREIKDSELKEIKKERLIKIVSWLPKSKDKDWVYDQAKEILFNRKHQGVLLKKIRTLEREFIELNKHIRSFKNLKILDSNGDGEQNLASEIAFYQLADHQKVGEIGAGFGEFSFISCRLFDFEKIYINELNGNRIEKIKKSRKEFPLKKDNIKIVKGSKKSTKLENKKLDKIIIRNTFHHFSSSDKMIKSIANSLSPNGRLYLSEPVTEIGGDKKVCPEAVSKKAIVENLSSFDFKLVREMEVGDFLLLEFKQAERSN